MVRARACHSAASAVRSIRLLGIPCREGHGPLLGGRCGLSVEPLGRERSIDGLRSRAERLDLLPRDVGELRRPGGSTIQLVAEGFRTLRELREIDVVHEPLLGEHCGVLDTAPGAVCALRDVERHDVTVEVRIPGPARRVQEFGNHGLSRHLE